MKLTIVIATKNEHKVKEIKKILKDSAIVLKPLSAFPPLPDIKEDGLTLEENALKKAETISRQFNCPVIADDSGLFVPALDGAPGVRSARYAGPLCDYGRNNRKLLKVMKDLKGKDRHAYFATCMALAVPGKKSKTRIGKISGSIAEIPAGNNGFGYDPIFIPKNKIKTFAEMTSEVKNAMSHRAIAVNKIVIEVKKLL